MAETVFMVNGDRAAQLAVRDRAVQYGDGVFETLAVAGGRPLCWEHHLRRLAAGCAKLGIPVPPVKLLADESDRILPGDGMGVLKIIVSRGESGRGYTPPPDPVPTRILEWFPGTVHPPELRLEGIDTCVCETRLGHNPQLAGIKHLNRLDQVLARGELSQRGVPEGIMRDLDGRVVAGTMSNLFLVCAGSLVTPDLARCGVAGIIREIVLGHARDWGFAPQVREVSLDDIESADEMFFTNSVIGVWPVRSCGERVFSANVHAGRILSELAGNGYVSER